MSSAILFPALQQQFQKLEGAFPSLAPERLAILHQLTAFIQKKTTMQQPLLLNFICTHNSRRSHLGQLWAQAAAGYYGIKNVHCYSGGTEATAFNPRAVTAMKELGFRFEQKDNSANPHYLVSYSDHFPEVEAFSKVYNDPFNPAGNYAAVMVCSHADENCPVVIGAEKRISLPFNDPKDYDGTGQEARMYLERALEIGTEVAFAFSQVRPV